MQFTFPNLKSVKTLFVLLFLTNNIYSAEIGIRDNGNLCYFGGVLINGQIEIGDVKKFTNALIQFKNLYNSKCNSGKSTIYASISSPGGDVDESLKIGKEIRQNSLGVVVPKNEICYSSCVFILAAGVSKISAGSIGIHRPYFSYLKSGNSMDEIRKKREIMNQQIKSYLNYVDVPENLLDEMLSYPPESLKILSNSELIKFRLDGMDATKNELDTAESASFYNISSAEYRSRATAVEKKCSHITGVNFNLERFLLCHDSVMLNVPESLAEQRRAKIKLNCSSYSGEQFKNCQRNILVLNN